MCLNAKAVLEAVGSACERAVKATVSPLDPPLCFVPEYVGWIAILPSLVEVVCFVLGFCHAKSKMVVGAVITPALVSY